MKRILIACDSFKDALGAVAVCQAIAKGIHQSQSEWSCVSLPLADGGEGTADILTHHAQGKQVEAASVDPLFRPMRGTYGLSKDGKQAFIDMASCSGLQLLSPEERNPMLTTTYGTGLLLKDAINRQVQKIVLGIGGSATNDAGIGMAIALGYQFLDKNGSPLNGVGGDLGAIASILPPDISLPAIEVLCDVNNPLFGPTGAAYVYGPQKGADPAAIMMLDKGLRHLGHLVHQQSGKDWSMLPGAGAAGGMGFAAKAFLNARLRSGIETVLSYAQFEHHLAEADLIITGEGKIDHQTIHGKLISGICKQAASSGTAVVALCGSLLASPTEINEIGLQAAYSILNRPMSLETALSETSQLLTHAAAQLASILSIPMFNQT
ncbi:MAG: glycerate kinase [Bacteroidota bacterium]